MFERLDDLAQQALYNAQRLAKEYGQRVVDAEHLLFALLADEQVRQLMDGMRISVINVKTTLTEDLSSDEMTLSHRLLPLLTYSPRIHRIMDLAWLEATALNQYLIGPITLLCALFREAQSKAVQVLLIESGEQDARELLKEAYAQCGGQALEQGDTSLALTYYRRLYQLEPTDIRIPKEYASSLKNTGKAEKATLSRFDQYSIIDESEVIDEPTVTFDAVVGVNDPGTEYYRIMRIFELVFLYPEQYRELASDFGILNTGMLLLFGPTGVGKTYICKAMAGEFASRTGKKLTFINARLSSVMDKWVGNTEKNITRLIEISLEKAPSLLVLDEIDSLGGERSGSVRDYKIDWVNHLLVELDRLKSSHKATLVVACTNALDRVDTALRRRLGTPIIIPLPDKSTRAQTFRLYIEHVATAVRAPIDYNSLAEMTVGFTPNDIEEAVQETINRVWLEIVDTQTKHSSDPPSKRMLRTEDFVATLREKTPAVSISKWVKDSVDQLRANGEEALSQRIIQMFKGYYHIDESSGQTSSQSPKKWFAVKI